MSDDMKMSGETQVAPEGTVAPRPAPPMIKPGLARRNVLLIVAAVIVLVAIVAFVGYALVLVGSNGAPVAGTPVSPGTPVAPGGTPAATSTAPLPLVPDIQFRDVFTPRDPFHPVKPVAIAVPKVATDNSTADDNSNTDTNSNPDNNPDTSDILTLRDIVAVGDGFEAVVRLNGTTYTLGAGDQVGDSTYSIVAVDENSVDVLHGDETFTIVLSS